MILATTHTRTHNIYIYIYGYIVLTEVIIMSLGQWMGLMQAYTYSRIRLVAC